MPLDLDTLRLGLTRTVDATDFPGLGEKYEGKVRDNYSLSDGTRVLVTTDRISAFDRVLGTLPFKGQVLNGLSTWWFAATADVAANHVLS
ncbi:MAG: phosphoribosylaminoimidazolesuccinocarboxamide synthase, partial [Deltaproteobacteria bacterium]